MTPRMRRILFVSASVVLLSALSGWAQEPTKEKITFTKDVLPILQERCQVCHQPAGANYGGMIAPMSFMTYGQTRPWAKAIVKATVAREMPPWDAAPEFNCGFENERTLTDEEIDTIKR